MQKLLIASLAVMAPFAIQQDEATATESVAATLISLYDSCQVQISNLTITIDTNNTSSYEQHTEIAYDLDGLSGCPDLLVTVWLEVPASSEFADANDTTIYESLDQVTSGAHTYEFNTTTFNGEYFAHVSITPYGLEVDFPMAEDSTSEIIYIPCTAKAHDLSIHSYINTDLDDVTVYSLNNIKHFIDFSFDYEVLWNCDLTANVTIY